MSDSRRTDAVLLLVALVWGSSYLSAQTATTALPVLGIDQAPTVQTSDITVTLV